MIVALAIFSKMQNSTSPPITTLFSQASRKWKNGTPPNAHTHTKAIDMDDKWANKSVTKLIELGVKHTLKWKTKWVFVADQQIEQ